MFSIYNKFSKIYSWSEAVVGCNMNEYICRWSFATVKWYDECVQQHLHYATSLAYLIIGYGYSFDHFIGFHFNNNVVESVVISINKNSRTQYRVLRVTNPIRNSRVWALSRSLSFSLSCFGSAAMHKHKIVQLPQLISVFAHANHFAQSNNKTKTTLEYLQLSFEWNMLLLLLLPLA